MADYRRNLANAIVDTMTASTSATSIPLQAGYGSTMPPVPYFMTFTPPGQLSTQGNSEIVLVSARSTDTLTVVRGQKGTTAKSIGTGWIGSASILRENSMAVGDIVMSLNATPQVGRIFMDGGTYNKSDYPLLYDHVLNNSGYGTTTSTTFTLTNMTGRVPVGKAASGTFATLASTGGAETHTLTEAQMPSHTHEIWHYVGNAQTGATNLDDIPGSGNRNVAGEVYMTTTRSRGGGAAHNNLQPYITVNYEVVAS